MSLKTRKSAVSVECKCLKPDWKTSIMSLVSKNALNWVKTIFSNNSERNGSFEISLKFERGINMDGSYAGSTIADLIHSTLFTKKERNWLHMSAEAFRVVAWGTFRIELMRDYDNFTQWFAKNISFLIFHCILIKFPTVSCCSLFARLLSVMLYWLKLVHFGHSSFRKHDLVLVHWLKMCRTKVFSQGAAHKKKKTICMTACCNQL